MDENKKVLINILENLLNAVKSGSWAVNEYKIDINNDVDQWAKIINHKEINMNVRISPINYCTIDKDCSGDNDG